MTTKITFGNFKGGVGKTTSSCMVSLLLKEKGYRVLLVDLDPQADSTEFLINTYQYPIPDDYNSLYGIMKNGQSLYDCIIALDDHMHIVPSGADLLTFPELLNDIVKGKPKGSQYFYIDSLVAEVEEYYDFIIFDVPPTQNAYNYNALVASNYVVAVLQTQSKALTQTGRYLNFIEDIQEIMTHEQFNYKPVELLGILPYLQENASKIDMSIIKQANERYGDLMFNTKILKRERVKRYDEEGINFKMMDRHDLDVFDMYGKVVDELLERVEQHDNSKQTI